MVLGEGMRSQWASSHVYPCIRLQMEHGHHAQPHLKKSCCFNVWRNCSATCCLTTTTAYANIWMSSTPLIPEQLCSFIRTSELKCLAPAGRMTPALLWRLDHGQHSAAIWKQTAQLFRLQTKEKINKSWHIKCTKMSLFSIYLYRHIRLYNITWCLQHQCSQMVVYTTEHFSFTAFRL